MSTVTETRPAQTHHAADLVDALRRVDLHDLADALDKPSPPRVTIVAERDLDDCQFCPIDGESDRFDPEADIVVTWADGHVSRDAVCAACIPAARHWHQLDYRVDEVAVELPLPADIAAQLAPALGAAA